MLAHTRYGFVDRVVVDPKTNNYVAVVGDVEFVAVVVRMLMAVMMIVKVRHTFCNHTNN